MDVNKSNKEEQSQADSNAGTDAGTQPKTTDQKKTPSRVEHYYYEVSGELLAKPKALSDVLESQGLPPTLVYCNSPSDADFVEVLLKKKGIGATKLIGYVSPNKLSRAMEKIEKHEASVIVLTDIAARGLNIEDFDMLINYSISDDPEIYFQRCALPSPTQGETASQAASTPAARVRKAISLVGPLDIASFHYLRKFSTIELVKLELPSEEDLFKAKGENLKRQALAKTGSIDASLKKLAEIVLQNPEKESIVSLLLFNTLEVIPQLNSSLDKAAFERDFPSEERFESRGRGREEGERGDRSDRGDRGGRGGREYDRPDRRGGRGRNGRHNDRRYGRGEGDYQDEYQERQGQDREPQEGGEEGYEGEADFRGERDQQPRQEREREAPRVKEDRLYLGHGSREGFSEEKFVSIVTGRTNVPRENIKRFSLREHYSFVDVPEEVSNELLDALKGAQLESGQELFVKRAITIVAPRESNERGGDEASAPEEQM